MTPSKWTMWVFSFCLVFLVGVGFRRLTASWSQSWAPRWLVAPSELRAVSISPWQVAEGWESWHLCGPCRVPWRRLVGQCSRPWTRGSHGIWLWRSTAHFLPSILAKGGAQFLHQSGQWLNLSRCCIPHSGQMLVRMMTEQDMGDSVYQNMVSPSTIL